MCIRDSPSRDPLLVLRAAVAAARTNLPLATATLANLAAHSPAISTPWSPVARSLFVDLLAAGPGLIPVWEGLDLAGLIDSWLPEWAAVRSRPQRNVVHPVSYTHLRAHETVLDLVCRLLL